MLKFGLFTDYVNKDSKIVMEKIIGYLIFFLEFDENYFKEIYSNNPPLKRSYTDMQKKTEDRTKNLGSAINLISAANVSIPLPNFISVLFGLSEDDDNKGENEDDLTLSRRQLI